MSFFYFCPPPPEYLPVLFEVVAMLHIIDSDMRSYKILKKFQETWDKRLFL